MAEFNSYASPKAKTERFKLYIDISEDKSGDYELQGKGIEAWTIDRGEEITKTKDVLGGVEVERSTPEPTQTGVRIVVRKDSKFAQIVAEAEFTGDMSKLDSMNIIKKYEFMDGDTEDTCKAKLEKDVTVGLPTFEGEAGGYLAYMVDFHYSNRFITGTMPKEDGDTITFTPDSAA
jgi:hypothetical protein